ncbi:hypothetical protein [Ruminococcus flavefaciens]|uniref:hypothetical protein n=1 Tax=Ruminococcus flavefaciens TaxID=1265 RepID=UPI000AB6F63A|nr:hypothetical protein [Ruminococcus flavefaciens]
MLKKRITSAIAALAMAATMSVSALSASAATYDTPNDDTSIVTLQRDYANYTSSAFYSLSSGNPAPMGMSTACIQSTSTDSNGNVTIVLKQGSLQVGIFPLTTCTIIDCVNSNTDANYFNAATSTYPYGTIVIPASDISSDGTSGYVDVTVTFGGGLINIISDITPMSNPMDLRLRLF